jgi:serine protease AprX
VLNLSFGTNATQAYTLDPLAYAAEVAWRNGIVTVISAGNNGSGGMTNPATDPYVIAVGATDTNGTVTIADDIVPSFSSQGSGSRLPDFLAPGSHIQSLRVPGSYIDTTYGSTGLISDRFFRGSGTSQAAAFASGAAALLVQANPGYTNDQIKSMLRGGANPITGATPQAQGQGVINLVNAANTAPSSTPQSYPPSTGTGTLEGARGDAHLSLDGVTLTGEVDIMGKTFDSAAMADLEAQGKSWAGGVWNGSTWEGSGWTGSDWTSATWTGKTWAGTQWSGKTWATGTWTSKGWTSTNFTSKTWTGSTWTGKLWAGKVWADSKWS